MKKVQTFTVFDISETIIIQGNLWKALKVRLSKFEKYVADIMKMTPVKSVSEICIMVYQLF